MNRVHRTITGSRAALAAVILGLCVGLVGCSSCGSEEPDTEPEVADQPEEVDEAKEEEEREHLSEAFGLPVPSDHKNIRWRGGRVEVTTDKSLEELRTFFESRVVDYEVIDEKWRFELVPLRSGAPSVSARYAARPERSPVRIEYRKVGSAQAATEMEAEADSSQRAEEAADDDRPRPTDPEWMEEHRGTPVDVRTEEGRLLAPGARWGEPYTPPEGSPLHTEQNKPNFGRPFGEWSGM